MARRTRRTEIPVSHGTGSDAACSGAGPRDDREEAKDPREGACGCPDQRLAMLENLPQMAWSMSADGKEEYFNRQWLEFTGFDLAEGDVARIDLVHSEDRDAALARWRDSLVTGEPYHAQYRLWHVSGRYRWILSRAVAQRAPDGSLLHWYGTCTEIHDQVEAQRALGRSEALTRSIVNASPDCVGMVDKMGRIQFVNEAACRALGFAEPGPLLGQLWLRTFPYKARVLAAEALRKASRGEIGQFTVLRRRGGIERAWDVIVAPVEASQERPDRMLVIARDITHQKSLENEARWRASHDSLTRLPNRRAFDQHLDETLARTASTKAPFAVMLLDLDRLKVTNDSLGHDAGDALLCRVADRLSACMRQGDFVARIGGDEFGLILIDIGTPEAADRIAEDILNNLREVQIYRGKLLDCRASIGASLFPVHGSSPAELVKQADIALYVAKADGRNLFRLFKSQMRDKMQSRLSMLRVARDAAHNDRVEPYYQPKVDLTSGRLAGLEALLRWRHPRLGIQPPEPIRLAFDDARVALQLADIMLGKVMQDVRHWLEAGSVFEHVAVNAAPAELAMGDYADRLLERLDRFAIPTRHVQVEITESVFFGQGDDCVGSILRTLSAAGIRIALDDFGTGYASLSHLKRFPIDIIKIDKSFIANIGRNRGDEAIIEAVVGLGRSLDIEVVAEGVETQAQESRLRDLGCDYAQGYLYGRAMPAQQLWQSRPEVLDAG